MNRRVNRDLAQHVVGPIAAVNGMACISLPVLEIHVLKLRSWIRVGSMKLLLKDYAPVHGVGFRDHSLNLGPGTETCYRNSGLLRSRLPDVKKQAHSSHARDL